MASTTVESPSDHLRAEALPLIDLRFLSQSELHALSLSSASSTVDFRRCDDVVVPAIDRSVFNESAGSRKQTYSRLRLAPRKPQISSIANTIPRPIHPRSPPESDVDEIEKEENHKIVGLLKELFTGKAYNQGDDNDVDTLIPVRVEYGDSVPDSSNVVLQTVTVQIADDVGGTMKRKRGRKPKNEMALVVYEDEAATEDRDKEIVNKNGVVVDFSALANMEDPFGPELKRQTEGMKTEEELLGFLSGLMGQWGSRRKKRKIVEASDFGDALPKGWKLILAIKKKDGRAWLFCRRYISPSGREFISCKEISSYLLLIFGPQDASMPNCYSDMSNQLADEISSGNAAVCTFDENKTDDITRLSPKAITTVSTDLEKQVTLLRNENPEEVYLGGTMKCHKCPMTFDENDGFLHHLLSSHKNSSKRRKLGTAVSDGVIIKNGVFECQFCHKIFHERHRYNGHVGIHVKNHVKSLEASSGVITMQNGVDPVSLGGGPPRITEMQITIASSTGSIAKPSNAIADDCRSSDSPDSRLQVGSSPETYTNKYNHELHSLPQERKEMQVSRSDKIIDGNSSDDQDREYMIANDKLQKVDGSVNIVAAESTCFLGAENTVPKDENNSLHEKFDEANVRKCSVSRVGQEGSSDSGPLAFSENEQTCSIKNNMNGVSSSLVEESKQDLGSESGSLTLNANENTCSTENIADSLLSDVNKELNYDPGHFGNSEASFVFGGSCTGPDENVTTGFKEQGSSEGLSFGSFVNEPKGNVLSNVNQQGSSEGLSFGSFVNEPKGNVLSNVNQQFTSIISESNEESGSGRGLLTSRSDGQTYGLDNNVNAVCSSILDVPSYDEVDNSRNKGLPIGFSTNGAGPDEDAANIFDQARNFESCSLVLSCNQQINAIGNNERGVSTGRMEDSFKGKVASKVPTSTSKKHGLSAVKNFSNSELFMSVGGSQSGVDLEVLTSFEQEKGPPSFSLVPSRTEQILTSFEQEKGSAGFSLVPPRTEQILTSFEQEKGSAGFSLVPPRTEQILTSFEQEKGSAGFSLVPPRTEQILTSFEQEKGSAGFSLVPPRTEQILTSFEQEKGSAGFSLVPPRTEQIFGLENNLIGVSSNHMNEPNQRRGFESSLLNPYERNNDNRLQKLTTSTRRKLKSDEVRNSWSSDLIMSLGGSSARLDVDVNRNFEGHSAIFSGNQHTFNVENNVTGTSRIPRYQENNVTGTSRISRYQENNVTGTYDGAVQEPNQESALRSNLLSHFGNEQLFSVENNSKQFYADTAWEGHRLGPLENSRNNDLMIGFGSSHGQRVEDVMAEAMWRTDTEKVLQSGLADASLPVAQSSNCFTSFDILSDKGENELFSASEKFADMPNFGGIRSGSMGQMEYNFFTPQTNSLPEDSKVLSFEAEMEQAYESSMWLGRDALLPKTASRNQFPAICVWCGNEFHHEAFNTGTQTGSIGYICPTCKANTSGQLNVL